MENLISVKESNLIFQVYPKIRYYYHVPCKGFYLENDREEKYDEHNKNTLLINPLITNEKGNINLSFRFFNEYRFDARKSKVILDNETEYSFSMNDSKNLDFSPTFYFNSEIILIKDLELPEKNIVMNYYREYIPSYNKKAFEAIDCIIKSEGKFLIPAHPSFAVINPSKNIQTIENGKIIEVEELSKIPKNEQYGFSVYCC